MKTEEIIALISKAKNELGHVETDLRDVANGELGFDEVNIAYIDSVIQRLCRIKDAVSCQQ